MLCLVGRYKDRILRFAVPGGEATLGSSPQSQIYLPFPGVSRTHARVSGLDGRVRLTDLSSKNGIWIGSERVGECDLGPGEAARLGQALLSVEEGSTSDFELGLSAGGSHGDEDPGGDTDSHRDWGSPRSPGMALRFVRRHEKARGTDLADRAGFLEEAVSILGAKAIVVLEVQGSGDEAVSAFGGTLPPSEVLDGIGRVGRAPQAGVPGQLHHPGGVPSLLARGERGLVAAAFAAGTPAVEPWQADFFEYVADRLLAGDREAPERRARGRQGEVPGEATETLVFPPGMVVGSSASVHELLSQMRATVGSRMDVLLLGETGTGKELFARLVHDSGPTARGPFVAINCAAIPSELLEAELFGVQARVATGVDARQGLFQQANGGTIFLDEIGELAESLQAKLLRVLQEREVLPLGAPAPRKVDVRVVSTSNRDLQDAVRRGRFRADLYYRLRGLQFHLPPLRERRDDLPALVLAFLERSAALHGKRIRGVSRKAMEVLRSHDWPGNVRELQNEVERAVLLCPDGGTLQTEHFRPVVWAVERSRPGGELTPGGGPAAAAAPRTDPGPTKRAGREDGNEREDGLLLQGRVDAVERDAIAEALRRSRGNKTLAARLLGITRAGLRLKLARLKLPE